MGFNWNGYNRSLFDEKKGGNFLPWFFLWCLDRKHQVRRFKQKRSISMSITAGTPLTPTNSTHRQQHKTNTNHQPHHSTTNNKHQPNDHLDNTSKLQQTTQNNTTQHNNNKQPHYNSKTFLTHHLTKQQTADNHQHKRSIDNTTNRGRLRRAEAVIIGQGRRNRRINGELLGQRGKSSFRVA